MLFQNSPAAGHYWFSVIDGFAVPDEEIRMLRLPDDIETIVLASDGYPSVKETLLESEQALHEVLRDDPLLFRKYKATKGMNKGQVSYDDRSYIKLRMVQKTA
ncbi:MAG: hypothetical protein J2P36_19440 [Ktedonobacteraceae bacterium]|nr:hypothetical protein [Ktedonobacteraceae bacterium]